jgi:hypothetical protein
MVERKGNNAVRRRELKYVLKKNLYLITRNNSLFGLVGPAREAMIILRNQLTRQENLRYEGARNELEAVIEREFAENGFVNPDEQILRRANDAALARRVQEHENFIRYNAHAANVRAQAAVQAAAQVVNPVVNPQGLNLGAIAHDRQNVHTATVVAKVKTMVSTILKIAVPADYAGLKTSGEIILECNLSKQAAWQMMAKYCQDENIYDLGPGIYSKVLASVWQYIKASPDSADLKKILASEMEDNIGMCAQGNLSRLCNILAGYIDGINPVVKSQNEIIGERLAPLMEIEDYAVRRQRARAILHEYNVVGADRAAWLIPFDE